MSQQIQITGGAKVRNLEGVLTGTAGVVNALGINVPSGIPQLDGSGKILVSQLPNSVMEYKGTWNATTNTPTLVNGTGNQGDVYLCNVAGTVNFGAGAITFAVGDQAIYSGTIWQKAGGSTGTVTSVAVTETGDALTITGSPITTSGTINIGFAGISGQYVNGAGGLTTFPDLTGYIPYTGATSAIDLNAKTVVNISNLGINTTTVPTILMRAVGDNNSNSRIAVRGYSSNANSSSMRVTKFRGTVGAPQAPQNGDSLGKFELAGYGTTSSEGYPQASFEGLATESWGATARGSKVVVKVTPNTTITQATALTINQDKSAVFESSVTGTSLIKTGGTSSEFLKADGSVDSSTYLTTSSAASTYVPYSGATANVDLGIYNMSAAYYKSTNGYVMGQGSTVGLSGSFTVIGATPTSLNIVISNTKTFLLTFPSTSRTYTYPDATGTLALTSDLSSYIQGSGTTNYVPKFTASGTIGNSLIYDTGSRIAIGGTDATYGVLTVQSDAGQFCIQSNTTPSKQLQIGYDHTSNNSYLSSLNQGVAFTTLALQPNGGNVAIGTSTASYILDVASSAAITARFNSTAAQGGVIAFSKSNTAYGYVGSAYQVVVGGTDGDMAMAATGNMVFSTSGSLAERMRITSVGSVLLGTTTSVNDVRLQVASSGAASWISGSFSGSGSTDKVVIGNLTGFGASIGGHSSALNAWATLSINPGGGNVLIGVLAGSGSRAVLADASGVLSAPISDISVKQNISTIGYGLNEILKMNPVWFDFIDEYKNYGQGRQNGNIAQEMETIIPEAVFVTPSTGKMGINYDQMHAVYIKAIQELEARIKQLENK